MGASNIARATRTTLAWIILSLQSAQAALYTSVGSQFYLKLTPLQNGFGPDGRRVLLDALAAFDGNFVEAWGSSIAEAGGSGGTSFGVDFSISSDIGIGSSRRPVPNQFPAGNDSFVQRASYFIPSIVVDVLDSLFQEEWTHAAFANNTFLPFLKENDPQGVFNDVTTVEHVALAEFTPEHMVKTNTKFLDQSLYLEFGPQSSPYARSEAGDIVDALDIFFQEDIATSITNGVETDIAGAIVYGLESAFFDGSYFSTGGYYIVGGGLVDQYITEKPSVMTTYEYGFEIHYWHPINSTDQLNTFDYVNDAFNGNSFVPSLLALNYTDVTFADALDTYIITGSPTMSPGPTSAPIVIPSTSPTVPPTQSPIAAISVPTQPPSVPAPIQEPTGKESSEPIPSSNSMPLKFTAASATATFFFAVFGCLY